MSYTFRDILPPQPHYLTGYLGYVPGIKFSCGRSYGSLTHDLFMERNQNSATLLSDLSKVDGGLVTPEVKELIEKRCNGKECLYTPDMKPGYTGYVPQVNFLCGYTFAVEAAMGLRKSEEMHTLCLCSECKEKKIRNKEIEENSKKTGYDRPLKKVPGGIEQIKAMYERRLPTAPSESPYFSENENPLKTFVTGYTGHIPDSTKCIGAPYSAVTNCALKSFTNRHEKFKADRQAPIDANERRPVPETVQQQLPYDAGMIKNYAGHVPGNKFHVGQTMAAGSKHSRAFLSQKTTGWSP